MSDKLQLVAGFRHSHPAENHDKLQPKSTDKEIENVATINAHI
jgi:hypothetical protein